MAGLQNRVFVVCCPGVEVKMVGLEETPEEHQELYKVEGLGYPVFPEEKAIHLVSRVDGEARRGLSFMVSGEYIDGSCNARMIRRAGEGVVNRTVVATEESLTIKVATKNELAGLGLKLPSRWRRFQGRMVQ